MTISEALKKFSKVESELLLAHVLKQSKEFLYLNPNQKLSVKEKSNFAQLLQKRLAGIPVAYLVGYKFFYGLKFKVNRNVLIPRPESEWIVDEALKLSKSKARIDVLDIGTGSGCLAISLAAATANTKIKITASDVSEKALIVAKNNAKTHKVKIKFVYSDLFKHINGKFNLIIANLPYVPLSDYLKLHKGLAYEPFMALTDGTDEFDLIKEFVAASKKALKPKGVLLIETDPASIKTLKQLIKKVYPKKKIKIVKDIHKLNRFIKVY